MMSVFLRAHATFGQIDEEAFMQPRRFLFRPASILLLVFGSSVLLAQVDRTVGAFSLLQKLASS